MDTKLLECVVCFELCNDCINCLKCNQILCKSHVKDLQTNQCPSCRATPFTFRGNIALQRIIDQTRETLGITNTVPPPSPTGVVDTTAATLATVTSNEADRDIESGSDESSEDSEDFEDDDDSSSSNEDGDDNLEEEEEGEERNNNNNNDSNIHLYGSKVPRNPPNQNQYRKNPNFEHLRRMKHHVRVCPSDGCQTVWRGPWGHFIGGTNGKTHFDLTNCLVGKRLNEQIGWDYRHPRL